jgi:hypothetical protein
VRGRVILRNSLAGSCIDASQRREDGSREHSS